MIEMNYNPKNKALICEAENHRGYIYYELSTASGVAFCKHSTPTNSFVPVFLSCSSCLKLRTVVGKTRRKNTGGTS